MKPSANAQNFDALPASGYIRQATLIQIVPFSAATLWRKVKCGDFPAPVKLSGRVTAWRVGDIREWMQSVVSEANSQNLDN